jgi:hypothetical protein
MSVGGLLACRMGPQRDIDCCIPCRAWPHHSLFSALCAGMIPRSLWAPGSARLRFQGCTAPQSRRVAQLPNPRNIPARAFHATAAVRRQLSPPPGPASNRNQRFETDPTPAHVDSPIDPALDPVFLSRTPQLPIRQHLEKWQAQHGAPSEDTLVAFERHPARSDIQNGMSKLLQSVKAGEDAPLAEWPAVEEDEGEEVITIGLFLKCGDVVELS